MTDEEMKTPDEWCKELGFIILDPDGWRTEIDHYTFEGGPRPYDEPVTSKEFMHRLVYSTIMPQEAD